MFLHWYTYLFVYIHVCGCRTHREVRGRLSYWHADPGNELRLSGLSSNTLTCWLSLLVSRYLHKERDIRWIWSKHTYKDRNLSKCQTFSACSWSSVWLSHSKMMPGLSDGPCGIFQITLIETVSLWSSILLLSEWVYVITPQMIRTCLDD